MTSMFKKVRLIYAFNIYNLVNCYTFIYYSKYCCIPVVMTDYTSHVRYLQVIRGLNPRVVINRVF